MSITRAEFEQAKQDGAASQIGDQCPHTGLLARAWREGRRQTLTEQHDRRMTELTAEATDGVQLR